MKVYARLANGLERDVTSIVSYRSAALTEDDEDVTLIYENMMYHDRKVPGAANVGGVRSDSLETTVGVSVTVPPAGGTGDVPNDDNRDIDNQNSIAPTDNNSNRGGQSDISEPADVKPPVVSQPQKVPVKASAPKKLVVAKKAVKVYFKTPPNASSVKKLSVAYRVKGTKKWKTKTFSYKKGRSFVTINKLKKGKKYQIRIRFGNAKGFGGYGKYMTSGKVK
jgi:hypothetical protein